MVNDAIDMTESLTKSTILADILSDKVIATFNETIPRAPDSLEEYLDELQAAVCNLNEFTDYLIANASTTISNFSYTYINSDGRVLQNIIDNYALYSTPKNLKSVCQLVADAMSITLEFNEKIGDRVAELTKNASNGTEYIENELLDVVRQLLEPHGGHALSQKEFNDLAETIQSLTAHVREFTQNIDSVVDDKLMEFANDVLTNIIMPTEDRFKDVADRLLAQQLDQLKELQYPLQSPEIQRPNRA